MSHGFLGNRKFEMRSTYYGLYGKKRDLNAQSNEKIFLIRVGSFFQ